MKVKERRPIWWSYRPPTRRDIRQFEKTPSLERLSRERRTRIKILRAGRDDAMDRIARRLERADGREPANSSCCPINAQCFQRYAASRMLKAFERRSEEKGKGKLWFVTVADQEDRIARGKLHELDVQALQRRMRKRLKRTLPGDVVVFCCLELKWEDETETYLPHHHIFVHGCEEFQVEPLRRFYTGKNDDGSHKMVVKPCDDPLYRAAYANKINVYRSTKRTRKTRYPNRRLRRRDFREHMLFLSNHDLTDFVFGIGARLDGR